MNVDKIMKIIKDSFNKNVYSFEYESEAAMRTVSGVAGDDKFFKEVEKKLKELKEQENLSREELLQPEIEKYKKLKINGH